MYHDSISIGIFSNTGHCYHYPAQLLIFTCALFNLRGNCFEMGCLNQLNSTVAIKYDFVESATEAFENST